MWRDVMSEEYTQQNTFLQQNTVHVNVEQVSKTDVVASYFSEEAYLLGVM